MEVTYRKHWSRCLQRDMELKVYGNRGKPVLVFPSGAGRFYEFEDFGMVEVVRPLVEAGAIQIFTVDSVDRDAWLAQWKHPSERGARHAQYDAYIVEEIVPFIHEQAGRGRGILTTGCSMGACHAANFFFKHPDCFDAVVALSGLYGPTYFVGDYVDDHIYFNFPLVYLPHLRDPWYLERFRRSQIVICVGQGAWEEDSLRETRALEEILHTLDVPAWFDYWGDDVAHDWPWWQKQLPYFLNQLDFERPLVRAPEGETH
ncbi:MAG: esterase family protein [Anaerolineae bacterium]|nr:esterase family protein [Anaerolineae bacterium]